ncbi:hypothetical protein JOM56_005310 [Amanita muscaria]
MSPTTIAVQNANTNVPWGHLADDALREIFLWCIDIQTLAHPILTARKLKSTLLPQLSVSRVCSTWRHVALYTPRLWTNVWIEFLTKNNIMIAEQWLSRARDVPVSIRLSFIGPEKEEVWRIALIEFLSCFRLGYLRFPIDATSLLHHVLLDLPLTSVADLRTLDLTNSGERGELGVLEVDDARFPELSYLSLQGKWVLLPRSNALHTLHADSVPMQLRGCWDILRGFPSLEDCKLTIIQDNSGLPLEAHEEIRLPHLRILRLYFRNGWSFGTFITPLSLPSLKQLEIYDAPIFWSTPAFFSLAQRSNFFPHLEGLIIRKARNEVNGNMIMELLPSLKSIALCDAFGIVSFNSETLEGLACGRLGPRLTKMELGYLPDVSSFLDMVELRLRNARRRKASEGGAQEQLAPFTRITLGSPTMERRDLSRRLQDLSDQGLEISAYHTILLI